MYCSTVSDKCKKPKGHDFLLAQKAKAKTAKRSNGHDLCKRQKLPKMQKWQIAPAMGAIKVVQNTARCVTLLAKFRMESMCDFDSLKERHKRF